MVGNRTSGTTYLRHGIHGEIAYNERKIHKHAIIPCPSSPAFLQRGNWKSSPRPPSHALPPAGQEILPKKSRHTSVPHFTNTFHGRVFVEKCSSFQTGDVDYNAAEEYRHQHGNYLRSWGPWRRPPFCEVIWRKRSTLIRSRLLPSG